MRHATLGLVCTAWLAAPAAFGTEPAKPAAKEPVKTPQKQDVAQAPVDEEFLEFLAQWDSEDEDWNPYLASLVQETKEKDSRVTAPRDSGNLQSVKQEERK